MAAVIVRRRRAVRRRLVASTGALAACLLVAACGRSPSTTPARPRHAAPRTVAAVPTVKVQVERLHSSAPPYTATLHVPVVRWPGHARVAAKVSGAVQARVDARVAAFTKGVERDLAGARHLPKSLPESHLTLTSRTERLDGRVLSFSFLEQPYFRGAANAAQQPSGLTFDLATGRPYALPGLFRPGADYLGPLSRLATAGLASFHPAGARCYLGKGPSAAGADFTAWWLTPSALVLSFPAGQYTAAYCGPPHVSIPVGKLKGVVLPGGPLG